MLAATGLILAGAVITAAIMVGTGFSRRPDYGALASGSASCTLSGTTTARGGTVTVCARYSVSANGKVHIRSVRASYGSPNGYSLPRFTVTLTDGATGILDDRVSGPAGQGDTFQSYSSQFTAFRGPAARGSFAFALGETMVVTLTVAEDGANGPYNLALASVALVLSRPPFPCPNPGTGSSGNASTPVC